MELHLLRKDRLLGYVIKEFSFFYRSRVTLGIYVYFLIRNYKDNINQFEKLYFFSPELAKLYS